VSRLPALKRHHRATSWTRFLTIAVAELVGVIKPGRADGKLSVEGALPSNDGGAVLLILAPAGRLPTRILLGACIEF
jgi:hypothetical protein